MGIPYTYPGLIKVVEVSFPIVGSLVAKHKAIASYQRWRAEINYQQGQKMEWSKTNKH